MTAAATASGAVRKRPLMKSPPTATTYSSIRTRPAPPVKYSFLASHGQDMAVAEYREALALEPGYPDAQLNLGLTLADQGQ
ncbi:tetratricopeptide repeat protein, partial [bacterium]|nr:tetratricopeptide repeat protein [bacterium]